MPLHQRQHYFRDRSASSDSKASKLHLGFKARIRHFTWTWFTMTVRPYLVRRTKRNCSNVSNRWLLVVWQMCFTKVSSFSPFRDALSLHLAVPYRFPGLYTIGCMFFLFNIGLFIFNVTMISLRFYYHPSTFVASILHPTETLFVPAWLVSLGIILINITQYGTTPGKTGGWLLDTMFVLFWVDCVLAVIFSCGIYLVMYRLLNTS